MTPSSDHSSAKPLRIFIGVTEISGYCSKLAQGFKALGVPADFVNLREHPFQYAVGEEWRLAKAIQFCFERTRSATIFKPLWIAAWVVLRALLFIRVLPAYDVFVFSFGISFLDLYDLPILKLFGKKVICIFYGSDARPPYLNGAFVKDGDPQYVRPCRDAAATVKRRVARIEHYADAVLSHPPYGLFHQKPFILNAVVGFPADFAIMKLAQESAGNSSAIRILHSPSNPILKGTPQIEAAVKNLQAKGHAIEWVTLSGQPNEVVLRELARCDFIVDQLYADWLMPGFATEAALMGKAVIIGGYDLPAIRDILPPAFRPPVHACHPDEIEAAIEKLIVDRDYRLELGRQARAFVEANWSEAKVAERLLNVIAGDVPDAWIYDPAAIRFFHGGGVAEERLRPFLRAYVEQEGKNALQLADKPDVERAFVHFVAGANPPE
jgi:hypothetical protein